MENKKHDFYKWDKDAPPLEIPVYDDHPTPNGAGWFYLKVKEFHVPLWLWGDDENHITTLCKQKGYAHLEWMIVVFISIMCGYIIGQILIN